MKLKTYLNKRGEAKKMAKSLNIQYVYFNAIINNRRTPSKKLALRISEATGGQVTVLELLYPESNNS